MANIAITTYCNLHCPYCFAGQMIQQENIQNITIDQLQNILNWLSKTANQKDKNNNLIIERIGLIGGEPTLHPEFDRILQLVNSYCEKYHQPSILFTNGIELEKYIGYIQNSMQILINVNSPKYMSNKSFQKLESTIDVLARLGQLQINNSLNQNHGAILGCNLCNEIDDYSFFWNFVDKYQLNQVRMSITAPIKIQYLKNKDMYYLSMKEKYLNFMKQAYNYQVKVISDCNQIPLCYFTKYELDSIFSKDNNIQYNLWKNGEKCQPIIDITPDFKASSCFGAYELIDCSNFNNIFDMRQYLLENKIKPNIQKNNTGICATCSKIKDEQCQGGCLAFATRI